MIGIGNFRIIFKFNFIKVNGQDILTPSNWHGIWTAQLIMPILLLNISDITKVMCV